MSSFIDDAIDPACFEGFISLVHELTGITIKPERQSMLVGRLRRRVRALELSSFEDYLQHLREYPAEHEHFINQITTNETYFFRTPRVWEYIEQTFLPEWQAQHSGKLLNVWSAASSTGEEAHTLGILLQSFKDAHAGFDYKVYGTDIDTTVLDKASQGIYVGRSIERFRHARPEWFQKYMKGNDTDGYVVVPQIKQRLNFSHFNLFSAPPAAPVFDLVLVRNVLIYFTPEDQERVMSTIHRRLNTTGVAIIGESESLNNLRTGFQCIAPTIYQPCNSVADRAA